MVSERVSKFKDKTGVEHIEDVSYEGMPTDEELRTLRRVPDRIPLKVYSLATVELLERMTYYGTAHVFVNFIQQDNPGTTTGKAVDPSAHNAQPGALGMGQHASTGITTFNMFWNYVIPLFGAFIADTYIGRFKMIFYSVFIAIAGHAIITGSATPAMIAQPKYTLAILIVGIIIIGISTGGYKPNVMPLIAEQLPRERMEVVVRNGERVLVDPAVTTARVYTWFWMMLGAGALTGNVATVYAERYVGFYLSFLFPTVFYCFAISNSNSLLLKVTLSTPGTRRQRSWAGSKAATPWIQWTIPLKPCSYIQPYARRYILGECKTNPDP